MWQLLSHPRSLSSLLFSLSAHCFLPSISLCCSTPWWERSSVSHLATQCVSQGHLIPPNPRFALVGGSLGVLVLHRALQGLDGDSASHSASSIERI